jgi:O-antigen/teichoic acid export membrane protein
MSERDERLDETATSSLSRALALVGSSMAIFTFLLFFLYPMYQQHVIDPTLFQVLVALIVLTIFSFAFSGNFYFRIIGIPKISVANKQAYLRRGRALFVLGLVFALSEPALILFTIGLALVGVIATGLWLLFTVPLLLHVKQLS